MNYSFILREHYSISLFRACCYLLWCLPTVWHMLILSYRQQFLISLQFTNLHIRVCYGYMFCSEEVSKMLQLSKRKLQ